MVASLGMASVFYVNALSFLGPLLILFSLPPRALGTAKKKRPDAPVFSTAGALSAATHPRCAWS
jgi:hypothetical protein